MKINVAAAVVGGLIVGAAAMVPLGSFAASDTPNLPPVSNNQDVATTDPSVATPETSPSPAPMPPVKITPPSFGAGDKTDKDDNDVEYGDVEDDDSGDDGNHDDGDREGEHEGDDD